MTDTMTKDLADLTADENSSKKSFEDLIAVRVLDQCDPLDSHTPESVNSLMSRLLPQRP